MAYRCESRIIGAVVHARGAIVTRRGVVNLPDGAAPVDKEGVTEVVFEGIPLVVPPGSFRADAEGGGWSVLSVSSELVHEERVPELGALSGELRDLRRRKATLDAEAQAILERRSALAAHRRPLEIQLRPSADSPADRLAERFEAALDALDMDASLLAALDARHLALEVEREVVTLERARVELELSLAPASADRSRALSRSVTVRLVGEGVLSALRLSYVVPAARWWPVYALRIDPRGRGTLHVDAFVAQGSGEDWDGIALSLSTADLAVDVRLPRLPALRYGRAQARATPTFRSPPDGTSSLFEGYDRAFAPHPVHNQRAPAAEAPASGRDIPSSSLADSFAELEGAADTGVSLGGAPAAPSPLQPHTPTRGSTPSTLISAIMPQGKSGASGAGFASDSVKRRSNAPSHPSPVFVPDSSWFDFDALRLAGPEEGSARGTLVRSVDPTPSAELASPSPGLQDPLESRGVFDHRYEAEGRARVPGGGQLHRVVVAACDVEAKIRFRTVPAASPEVHREAHVKNPLDAPLLGGPVDVFLEGALLAASSLGRVDRGGTFDVGLGTDDRVKVARNVRTTEESAGLLGGGLAVTHEVRIEVASAYGEEIAVEILERVPVTDDRSIEIKRLSADPEPLSYDQSERGSPVRGGLSFRLAVPPSGKRTARLSYRLIFSGKLDIVGGSRRG